ncbi:MAG: BldC family transcriptional regulator [Acidimicrobiia bacterium]
MTDISTRLMKPSEVALRFGVDPKTVVRWAHSGKLRYVRTLGGHHRFYAKDVEALIHPERGDRQPSPGRGSS